MIAPQWGTFTKMNIECDSKLMTVEECNKGAARLQSVQTWWTLHITHAVFISYTWKMKRNGSMFLLVSPAAVLAPQIGTRPPTVLLLLMSAGRRLWYCPSPCSISLHLSSPSWASAAWLLRSCRLQTLQCSLQLQSSAPTYTRTSSGLRWEKQVVCGKSDWVD